MVIIIPYVNEYSSIRKGPLPCFSFKYWNIQVLGTSSLPPTYVASKNKFIT